MGTQKAPSSAGASPNSRLWNLNVGLVFYSLLQQKFPGDDKHLHSGPGTCSSPCPTSANRVERRVSREVQGSRHHPTRGEDSLGLPRRVSRRISLHREGIAAMRKGVALSKKAPWSEPSCAPCAPRQPLRPPRPASALQLPSLDYCPLVRQAPGRRADPRRGGALLDGPLPATPSPAYAARRHLCDLRGCGRFASQRRTGNATASAHATVKDRSPSTRTFGLGPAIGPEAGWLAHNQGSPQAGALPACRREGARATRNR